MSKPYHLSERHFRKYEAWIREALERFPQTTHVVIPNHTQGTLAYNLRSALRSFRENHWSVSWVFDETCLAKLKVSCTENGVFLASKDCITPSFTVHRPQVLVQAPSTEALNALCLLIHLSIIKGPFVLKDFDTTLIEQLYAKYDVAIVPTSDDQYILT